jgi:hypothetical protein
VHEIKADKPIKELLEKNQCYIVNDDDLRIVYLWKGAEASVRSKFIGASKSQEVRGQVGMNYKCVPIDQDSEPTEFLEAIKKTPSKGFAKEIKEEMKLQFEVGGGPIKPRVTKLNSLNEDIQQSGPMFTGSSKSDSAQSFSRGESAEPTKKEASKDVLNKIIETLDNERIPEGLEREMIIIGETAYSVAEKVKTFLGKKQTEKVLEPISTLPEGIFFAEGYTPRVVVKNQTVVAIEFLKKKE